MERRQKHTSPTRNRTQKQRSEPWRFHVHQGDVQRISLIAAFRVDVLSVEQTVALDAYHRSQRDSDVVCSTKEY